MNQLSKMFDMSGMDLTYVLAMLGVFVSVCILATYINYAVVEPLRKRRQITQRIRSHKREQEFRAQIFKAYQDDTSSPIMAIVSRLTGWGKLENLQRQLLQADIYLSAGVFIGIVCLMGGLGFIVASKIGIGFWAWVLGPAIGFMPIFFLRWKKNRKTLKFEKHMPEAMEVLARSLRSGHTLSSTLELVAQEIPAPLGKEMRIAYEEQRLGLSVSQALRRMSERVASQDLRYFVTAVLIQAETGGNLAEILENIGLLIRERLTLKGKVRALTAEGRFSAYILTALPIFTFCALFYLNRPYIMTLLINPLGVKILTTGIMSIIFGFLLMKKMVTIKV